MQLVEKDEKYQKFCHSCDGHGMVNWETMFAHTCSYCDGTGFYKLTKEKTCLDY